MPAIGTQGWLDLTVDDAAALRDFYAEVLGWTPAPVAMSSGDESWEDYSMLVDGSPVAGVCHRRGENAKQPPVWVPYFVVASLDSAVAAAQERGATVVDRRRKMAVLRDPADAVFALWQGD